MMHIIPEGVKMFEEDKETKVLTLILEERIVMILIETLKARSRTLLLSLKSSIMLYTFYTHNFFNSA